MPEIEENESRKRYVSRCMKYVIEKEGLKKGHAYKKCNGMYDQYLKRKRGSK